MPPPPKTHHTYLPEPMSGVWFGKRVFAHIIKHGSQEETVLDYLSGWALNPMTSVLLRDTQKEKKRLCDNGSRKGLCSHKPRNARSHQKPPEAEARKNPPTEPSGTQGPTPSF